MLVFHGHRCFEKTNKPGIVRSIGYSHINGTTLYLKNDKYKVKKSLDCFFSKGVSSYQAHEERKKTVDRSGTSYASLKSLVAYRKNNKNKAS